MPQTSLTEVEHRGESRSGSASSLRYMPGLDVMRGLAITMVLIYHGSIGFNAFFDQAPAPLVWLQSSLHLLRVGVHLFFILSGFLITGILLDSQTDTQYFRNFYLRRALRIVPAYLAVLAVLFFLHYITPRYLVVCLLYFCNMTGIFGVNAEYGPLWSLSVEEQFYLVWPLVVRRITPRSLWILSLALIAGTPLLRFVLLCGPAALHDVYYKTYAVLDFFAAGSCLAIAVRNPALRQRLPRLVVPLLVTGVLTLGLLFPQPQNVLLQRLLKAVELEPWLFLFSGLVLLAYLYPGIASWRVARPMVFLSSISYGLYLYHVLIFEAMDRHWPGGSPSTLPLMLFETGAEITVSILVAYLSRKTLEEFFLRMKPKHHPGAKRFKSTPEIT